MLHHESIKFDFCSVKYILYTLGLQPYPQVVGPLKPTLTTFLGGSWSLGIYIYCIYIYIPQPSASQLPLHKSTRSSKSMALVELEPLVTSDMVVTGCPGEDAKHH